MPSNNLLASPWWVNLLILVPAIPYFLSRKEKLHISRKRLFFAACFGAAFGFVEAAVVIYLRAATGMSLGYQPTALAAFSQGFFVIEFFREMATILMLVCVAWLMEAKTRERIMAFLWMFAFWDIFYYIWLYATIRWPSSLVVPDVLFLIPVPWLAQVWFPILVSGLTALMVWLRS